MSRLEEIEARLSEKDSKTDLELLHVPGCAHSAGFECECMRSDIEWLAYQVKHLRHGLKNLRTTTEYGPELMN